VGVGAGDRDSQALAYEALGYLAYALGDLYRPDEASQAFERALDLWQQLGGQGGAMQCLAGLAHITLTQGHLAAAQDHVEEILSYLETDSLDRKREPFRVYLTCYRVLRANGDPRADDPLQRAHALLQERAARINDEDQRRSYLQNVEEHREIVSEYGRWRSDAARE
jgi:tetratricopeptide (TPR) repeat protein